MDTDGHRWKSQIRSVKSEIRIYRPWVFRSSRVLPHLGFVIRIYFGFRHSTFGFSWGSSSLFPSVFICVYLWFDPVFSLSRFSGAECSPLEWLPQSTFRFQIFP